MLAGSCSCNNMRVNWHTLDHSLVPRACQCVYCLSRSAAYVSKSGTRFEVFIGNSDLHRTSRQGSNSAVFHECAYCNELVFVTASIESDQYGALNANCLNNTFGFGPARPVDYGGQSAQQKLDRWKLNWCCPVLIHA